MTIFVILIIINHNHNNNNNNNICITYHQLYFTSFSLIMTALYPFTNHTFNNADKTGPDGPNLQQVRTKYNVTWGNDYLNMNNNGIQLWTVPVSGSYRIRAVGASGSNEGETSVQVGNPADMAGTFSLIRGEVIKILVGQTGWLGSSSRPGWGGGGGTFVVKNDDTPLIVAGGCGSGHTTKILRRNDEGAKMGGFAVNFNVPLSITYISRTTAGVKVYIVKDLTLTKVVSANSDVRIYYEGEPEAYDPAKLDLGTAATPPYTTQADSTAYVMQDTINHSPEITFKATSASGTRQNANTGESGMLETGTAGTWSNTSVGGGDGAGFDNDGSIGNGIIYDNLPGTGTHIAPKSFKNGGIGGSRGGGFGGGGSVTNTWGGGGGGYKGGQGGKTGTIYNGGGGGSFNLGTSQTNALFTNGITTMTAGFVTITILQTAATLTTSKLIFYQKFVSGATVSFDGVISSNAGAVYREHVSNNIGIVTILNAPIPSATIVAPGKTTIKVTQPETINYTQVSIDQLITIVIVGSGQSYTNENMTGVDLTNTTLSGSVFSICNLTSANFYEATFNAATDLRTSTLTLLKSGRINGLTTLLPAGYKMI